MFHTVFKTEQFFAAAFLITCYSCCCRQIGFMQLVPDAWAGWNSIAVGKEKYPIAS